MKSVNPWIILFVFYSFISLCSCSSQLSGGGGSHYMEPPPPDYSKRIPNHIETSEQVVIVDPRVHAWGAYGADGNLVRAGLATAGSDWCSDLGRPCHTSVGTFHINSLGSESCHSHRFPLPRGGAPMPYCMYFNSSEALHGSPSGEVIEGNVSHGCVRMRVEDAEWMRFNFARVGTKVIIRPYS